MVIIVSVERKCWERKVEDIFAVAVPKGKFP